jgi:hypothetical protein
LPFEHIVYADEEIARDVYILQLIE